MTSKPVVVIDEKEESPVSRPIHECLTGKIREMVEALPQNIREERIEFLQDRFTQTSTLRCIKMNFWKEYQRVIQLNLPHISPTKVCEHICSREYFYSCVVHKEEVLAWLLHPITDYETKAEEALDFGIDRLRNEIMTAPILDEKGKYNPVVGNQVLQALKFLDARVKGSPLQKIEQKTLHAHAHLHKHEGVTRESLLEEMREIESRLMGNQQALQIQAPDETE